MNAKIKNVKRISSQIFYAYCSQHACCKNSMSSTVSYFEHSRRLNLWPQPTKLWNLADLSWTAIKGENKLPIKQLQMKEEEVPKKFTTKNKTFPLGKYYSVCSVLKSRAFAQFRQTDGRFWRFTSTDFTWTEKDNAWYINAARNKYRKPS